MFRFAILLTRLSRRTLTHSLSNRLHEAWYDSNVDTLLLLLLLLLLLSAADDDDVADDDGDETFNPPFGLDLKVHLSPS